MTRLSTSIIRQKGWLLLTAAIGASVAACGMAPAANVTRAAAPAVTASPAAQIDSARAGELCGSFAAANHLGLVAAFDSTVSSVIAWQTEGQPQNSSVWADHAPSSYAAVCYMSGEFAPGSIPGSATADRMSVVITPDGTARAWSTGNHAHFPIVRP